jgi:hypothetical protein
MRFIGYAMIIGAMKSGTTTLHYILAQHPEIATGLRKELNFFRRRKREARGVADYEAMFPRLDKLQHAYTLESSPNYTKPGRWDFVPSRIAELPGRKRLVYVLRNPIERIDSHIAHNVAEGRWTAEKWPLQQVLNISAYASQLAKFEKVGLLDDVLLVDFSELSADPVGLAYRIHDFLGIPRVEPRSVEIKNTRKLDVQFLRPDQLPKIKQLLQADVETLITRYGFEQARSWSIV